MKKASSDSYYFQGHNIQNLEWALGDLKLTKRDKTWHITKRTNNLDTSKVPFGASVVDG